MIAESSTVQDCRPTSNLLGDRGAIREKAAALDIVASSTVAVNVQLPSVRRLMRSKKPLYAHLNSSKQM